MKTRIRKHRTGGWNIEALIERTYAGVTMSAWEFQAWTDGSREDARSTERDVRARLQEERV